MKRELYISVLIAVSISGCALQSKLHSFPKEAGEMIQDEKCDCEKIEFVETGTKIELAKLMSAKSELNGYMLDSKGIRTSYSVVEDAVYVDADEEENIIMNIFMTDFMGLVTQPQGEPWSSYKTFDAVKQTKVILNPFDGKQYTLLASSNGRSIIVKIVREDQGKIVPVGVILSQHYGNINGRAYKMSVERKWEEDIKKEKNGETIWHHYPDGIYMLLSDKEGLEVKLFQGVAFGKVMGLNAYAGYKSVAFIPKGTRVNIKRDLFLFYYGAEFFEEFTDDVMSLPDCFMQIKTKREEEKVWRKNRKSPESSCPESIIIKTM